jgi:uncharacterized protein (TIGR03435 family)
MQCSEVRNCFADYVKERLDMQTQAEFAGHLKECASCSSELDALTDVWIQLGTLPAGEPPSSDMDTRIHLAVEEFKHEFQQPAARPTHLSFHVSRLTVAVGLVAVLTLSVLFFRILAQQGRSDARLENGVLLRVAGNKATDVRAGDAIRLNDILRSSAAAHAMLLLADGSRVEVRSQSELSLERKNDGISIRLRQGGVIVTAARQHTGHLYVQTRDVVVSVVGTVFIVNAEEEGSRVAVIQGEVRVQQGAVEKKLLPGEQVATSPRMVPVPMIQELAWSQNLQAHLALLQQSLAVLQPAAPPIVVPQAPAIPKWEAVSIKPCSPDPSVRGGGRGGLGVRPGRLIMTCMPIMFAIQDAYVRSAGEILKRAETVSISGGPGWINSDLYSIEAKAEGRPTGQIMEGPMLQALLEDRFKLKIRREVKEVSVYELTVDKGGLKIEPLKDEDCSSKWVDPALDDRTIEERFAEKKAQGKPFIDAKGCGATRFGPPREPGKPSMVDFYGMNFDDIAAGLRIVLDRDTINKTGLSGLYHFHLTFQPDQTTAGGAFHAAPVDDTPTGAPTIFKAMQEQMGMRLESAKGPGESFVVESIERPTEN